MSKIPCIYFRGGTSKGPCFLREDLPSDLNLRDEVLLKIMGSPDERQIDGLGGGNSLSSKVVIVEKSKRRGIDINYYFCQVLTQEPIVETTITCGNMLSAVAPFAIERGLVKAEDPETTIRIYDENTGMIMESVVQTPGGKMTYHGTTSIDGVPGTSAPIKLTFLDAVGSKTKKLLPTGNVVDAFGDVAFSCVDVAGLLVIVAADSLGKTGCESKAALDGDKKFLAQLEMLRQKAAEKMGLGDVSHSLDPRVCLIAPPQNGGTITSRYFTPFDCHSAHAVSAAVCLAAACLIPGTLPHSIAKMAPLIETDHEVEKEIIIEHLAGKISALMTAQKTKDGMTFPKASCIRTARPLFDGYAYAE